MRFSLRIPELGAGMPAILVTDRETVTMRGFSK